MNLVFEQGEEWLLIANGAPVSKKKLWALAENKKVMVLDGAYAWVRNAGIVPDILLGDFDSIDAVDLVQAANTHTQVIEAPDQNRTDLQKGLDHLEALGAKNICICSGVGRRVQHTIYNLRILKKYHNVHRPLRLVSETEVIRYYEDTTLTLTGEINDSVGLLGFPHAIVSTSGLTYDVTHYDLDFEKSTSVLNSLANTQARIELQGALLLIHETEKEHLLIS